VNFVYIHQEVTGTAILSILISKVFLAPQPLNKSLLLQQNRETITMKVNNPKTTTTQTKTRTTTGHSSICGSSSVVPTRNIPTASSSRISTTTTSLHSSSSSDSSADADADADTNNYTNLNLNVNKNVNVNGFVRQGLEGASILLSKLNVKARRKEKEIEETMVKPIVIHPSLHMIPDNLSPYYQPLPPLLQVINLLLGTWLAAISTWKHIPRWHPFSIILWLRTAMRHTAFGGAPSSYLLILRQVSMFLFKSITLTLAAQCCLQEIYKKPSRISMNNLLGRHFLPSTLSRYSKITIPAENSTTSAGNELATTKQTSLGVHYLQYDNNNIATIATNSKNDDSTTMLTNNRTTACFDAIYFQHGFGASSLSWLPLFVPLAHKLGARTALGHDAVGFGFTDRPKDAKWYTSKQSASIAQQILLQNIGTTADADANSGNEATKVPPVALVGHSMGSLSILRLATQLPRNMPKLVILSSPALGLLRRRKPSTSDKTSPQSWMGRRRREIGSAIQNRVALPITRYILRRAVGTKNSWRAGLSLAYGNKETVTESDAMRYAWPSIGHGWEDGLLNFAAAQQMPQEDELDDDVELMRRVLELPNTKVVIILGSKDKVVPSKLVYKFVEKVKATTTDEVVVPIIEMEGLGHCAFEEDSDAFCLKVGELVNDHWD
ncbi:MAG: pimeloyl-ACP methyl ester carboxylesterase, partial [Bacillariaceae sp.]|jgi:pimeloyl-ACP methyl ester carboxylesterase